MSSNVEKKPTFVAIAHRWGSVSEHWYIVAAGPDQEVVDKLAGQECEDRGGKYGVAIYAVGSHLDENAAGDDPGVVLDAELVGYHASLYGEIAPAYNPRARLIEALGFDALCVVEDGMAYLSDPEPGSNRLLPTKVDVPAWLADRALYHARVERVFGEHREKRGQPVRAAPPREDALDRRLAEVRALVDELKESTSQWDRLVELLAKPVLP